MELLPHCAKTQWHAFGHDLFSAAGGKQQAFAATLARYGLTPAQCMAFGDSDNDIGLLTAAGIGVAMEAGTDGVTSFSAGDLTVHTGGDGAGAMRRQAERLMAPYLADGFAFRGVLG